MAAYSPPHDISIVHDFPRFDAVKNFNQVSNVFDPAFTTTAGQEYLGGVGSLAGAFIAIACLLLIVYGIVFGAACCCRNRLCSPVKKGKKSGCLGKCCGYLFSPRLWYLLAVVCLLAGAAAAISVLSKVQNSVNSTVHGFEGFNSLLNTASASIDSGLLPVVGTAKNQTQYLIEVLQGAAASPAAVGAATALAATTAGLESQLSEVTKLLGSATRTLNAALGAGSSQFSVSTLGSLVYKAGLGVIVGFLLFVVFSTIGLVGKPWGAKALRGSLCVLALVLFVVWMFGAFFFTVSLFGSDVCVGPSAAVLAIVNVTSGGSDAYSTTLFYTSPCGSVQPIGAYGQLVGGQEQAVSALVELSALNATIGPAVLANATVSTLLGEIDWSMQQVVFQTNATVATVACNVVYSQYLQVVDGLCTGFVNSAIGVFGLATATAVLMIVMASAAASLAFRHPGDVPQAAQPLIDDDDVYLPMTYGGMPSRQPPKAPYQAGNYSQYTSVPKAAGHVEW